MKLACGGLLCVLAAAAPLAATPIRTTSPGTIVFRGGALAPRIFFSREVAGPYRVTRHRLLLYGAYSPTPRTLLEVEAPFDWVRLSGPNAAAHFVGPANATVWAKYRFYRTLETWGDRHAAVRLGIALPTGMSQRLPAAVPPPVLSQLQPATGAWSPTLDLTYGGGIRRFVYHLNAQQTFGVERGRLRPGHTTRGNLDFEYIFLPRHYREPTRELFGLLEIPVVHRTAARFRGREVAGTGGTQLLLAPGLQYVATRRLLFEASFQIPVLTRSSELQLRSQSNLLLGVRWLF